MTRCFCFVLALFWMLAPGAGRAPAAGNPAAERAALEDAIRELDSILQEDPQHVEALLDMALYSLEAEQPARTLEAVRRLESLGARVPGLGYLAGRALEAEGRTADAARAYAGELEPDSIPGFHLYRALNLVDLGRFSEARQALDLCAARDADFGEEAREWLRHLENGAASGGGDQLTVRLDREPSPLVIRLYTGFDATRSDFGTSASATATSGTVDPRSRIGGNTTRLDTDYLLHGGERSAARVGGTLSRFTDTEDGTWSQWAGELRLGASYDTGALAAGVDLVPYKLLDTDSDPYTSGLRSRVWSSWQATERQQIGLRYERTDREFAAEPTYEDEVRDGVIHVTELTHDWLLYPLSHGNLQLSTGLTGGFERTAGGYYDNTSFGLETLISAPIGFMERWPTLLSAGGRLDRANYDSPIQEYIDGEARKDRSRSLWFRARQPLGAGTTGLDLQTSWSTTTSTLPEWDTRSRQVTLGLEHTF